MFPSWNHGAHLGLPQRVVGDESSLDAAMLTQILLQSLLILPLLRQIPNEKRHLLSQYALSSVSSSELRGCISCQPNQHACILLEKETRHM